VKRERKRKGELTPRTSPKLPAIAAEPGFVPSITGMGRGKDGSQRKEGEASAEESHERGKITKKNSPTRPENQPASWADLEKT